LLLSLIDIKEAILLDPSEEIYTSLKIGISLLVSASLYQSLVLASYPLLLAEAGYEHIHQLIQMLMQYLIFQDVVLEKFKHMKTSASKGSFSRGVISTLPEGSLYQYMKLFLSLLLV
jgi:hypothetical protein